MEKECGAERRTPSPLFFTISPVIPTERRNLKFWNEIQFTLVLSVFYFIGAPRALYRANGAFIL